MTFFCNSACFPPGNIDSEKLVLFSTNTKTGFLWSILVRARYK